MNRLYAIALLSFSSLNALAGAFIFSGDGGTDIVTHPEGYTGSGGVVTVSVCINPASDDLASLEAPVQNIVATWNALAPTTGNVVLGGSNNVPSGQMDWESVVLHEVGHCLGLAHPNLASESLLPEPTRNHTKTTKGTDDLFNTGAGPDTVIGSSDDVRGDDVNLHWFNASNNPFTAPGTIDASTYSIGIGALPGGHSFVANGDLLVSTLLGVPGSEAVMQQGSRFDEDQRRLGHDDFATLRLGMSGVDMTQGTADDYTVVLTYVGITTSCDIPIFHHDTGGSLAFCSITGSGISGSHVQVSSASIETGSLTVPWFYNSASSDVIFANSFE